MEKLLKFAAQRFYRPLVLKYISKERNYRYRDIQVVVKPGIFHPGLFFSTKVLLNYLAKHDLKNKKFLELGAGTGLISIYAARKKAQVTATDISEIAVENIKYNIKLNQTDITVYQSDLFTRIPIQVFDIIAINPPYYPRSSVIESDYAWFCGTNYEYFQRLFSQMKDFIHCNSIILMILSDVCEINRVEKIANEHNFIMDVVFQKQVLWERNFIYKIQQTNSDI